MNVRWLRQSIAARRPRPGGVRRWRKDTAFVATIMWGALGLAGVGLAQKARPVADLRPTSRTDSVASPPSGRGPVLGTLVTELDSLIPGASGVFLADVTDIKEHDDRPTDGDLYQAVVLRPLLASGLTRNSLYLLRESGGLSVDWLREGESPRPPPPRPRFSVRPDEFEAGRRYWFASASEFDSRYPQGIAGYWPMESTQVVRVLERAVEQDAFAWHPEIWPSGYTTGWFDDPDRSSSSVRVWKTEQLLWEKQLNGLLTHGLYAAWYVHRGEELGYMRPPGLPDKAMVLVAEVRSVLDTNNAFGLPARSWRIQHLLDMSSGRIVASRVRADQVGDVERVYQAYDRDGALKYERVQDLLTGGGRSVGSKTEDWLRRVERWLNPRTGRVVREEVRRFASIPTSYGSRSDWLLVDQRRGLAAGPLRVSSGP